MLGFDDYPDIAARLRSIVAGEQPPGAHARRTAASCSRSPRSSARCPRPPVPGHASGPASLRRRLDSGPTAPLKLASGCDRRCSFCAIPSFRGSFVSRRPSDVLPGGALAGRAGRARAVPRQRELHVLRQGPRRPAAARDAAARAGGGRRRRAGAGVLPPARRDPPGPDRGDRDHARRRAVLRPVLPARQRRGAAPDAPLRRPGELPRPARADPGARAGGRRAQQRDRRVPRRDRATTSQTLCDFLVAARLDVTGVFGYSDEDGTEAATYDGQARRGRGPRPASSTSAPWSRSSPPSARRSGSASSRGARRGRRRRRHVEGRAAHQGPEVDGSTYLLDVRRAGR